MAMGRAALEHVGRRYSRDVMAAGMAALYRRWGRRMSLAKALPILMYHHVSPAPGW